MFEFQKLCNEIESLDRVERAALTADTAIEVVKGLKGLDLPEVEPIDAFASFVIGSVISDGSVSEKDYLNIYPALSKAIGDVCDLAGIERKLKVSKDVVKEVTKYTQQMNAIIAAADSELSEKIVMLCLLITAVDGKISLKEQHYVKQICKF